VLDVRLSDHVTPLVGALVEQLARPPEDPFAPEWVAVPSIGMRRWLAQRLGRELGTSGGARADGVTANVELPFPGDLRARVLAADAAARGRSHDPWSAERLLWTVMDVLADPASAADPVLGPVTRRAEGATLSGRAAAIADLIDRYLLHRPGMVRSWLVGDDVDAAGDALAPHHRWQPVLVRQVRERIGEPSPAERAAEIVERVRSGELELDLPERLFLFGLSTLPPDVGPLLAALSERRDVHAFLLTPSVRVAEAVAAHVAATVPRGRGPRPAPTLARRSIDLSGLVRHPLLRSWGAPSRETAALLGAFRVPIGVVGSVDRQPALGDEVPEVPDAGTLLGRLQADLRRDRPLPGAPSDDAGVERPAPHRLAPGDRSIQVHSCTGTGRQVEVLRDAILHLLAEDPSLTEGDVAVLCPRVEELAPVIQAVLGPSADDLDGADDAGRAPALRYRITDRSTRSEVPLLGALGALVDLLPGRFTASEVADFLGLGPVRNRFRLDADDLSRLDEWIEQANIRWGLDGEHRARWGLPADFEANSWAAGLDRLLVSTAVRPAGTTLAVGSIAPFVVGDGAVVPAARVADAVRTLADVRARAQGSRTIDEWCELLADAVERLCSLPPSEAWQRRRLDRVLADLLDASRGPDGSASTVPLTLADVRRLISDRLAGEPARAAFGTGAVTFCSLSPLRSVPHKVVCVLGLDHDALPRGAASGDDLLALAPALGDRDPRAEARQLLLEAVLSAQQSLVITCGGADVRTNAPIPPAVVLDELWDCLAATCGLGVDEVRARLLVEHPRQPFDRRNFEPGALGATAGDVPWSFDPAALDGARALLGRDGEVAPPVLLPDPLPVRAGVDGAAVRSLDELGRFLKDPVGSFLRLRLQVRLPELADVPSDDLPVELDPLEAWRVGAALMEADRNDDPRAEVRRLLQAAGDLPPGSLGEELLEKVEAAVAGFRDAAERLEVGLVPDELVDVDAELTDGTVLRGTIELHRRPGAAPGPLLVRYSRPKPHHVLVLAAQLLALTAARPEEPWRAVSIHRAKTGTRATVHELRVRGEDPDERRSVAFGALGSLVDLWDLGRRVALPLFDATSYELARAGWGRAGTPWEGGQRPENADPAVRMAFGARSLDELRALRVAGNDPQEWAERLWRPVLDAVLDEEEAR
jgi:exodeoxyribonuclease V gamma subunit